MDKLLEYINNMYRGKIYTLIAALLVWMGAIAFGVFLRKALGLESFLLRWVFITPFTIVALSVTRDLLHQRSK